MNNLSKLCSRKLVLAFIHTLASDQGFDYLLVKSGVFDSKHPIAKRAKTNLQKKVADFQTVIFAIISVTMNGRA